MTKVCKANISRKAIKSDTDKKVVSTKIRGIGVDTSRFRYNQIPVETPNGVIVEFTLPNSEAFVTGLIEVFINGNQKIKDTEWEETGTTKITLIGSLATTPPTSGEKISLNYIKQ
ncbi:MAG: hypothetical protein PHY56_05410 [Candidatus Omnitrophica bacterium]|nr:hypothetical protein [Candidatus Omnitrophota bacterium]